MIAAVDSDDPPLHLILGADSDDILDRKRAAMDADIARWRDRGVATAYPDAITLSFDS